MRKPLPFLITICLIGLAVFLLRIDRNGSTKNDMPAMNLPAVVQSQTSSSNYTAEPVIIAEVATEPVHESRSKRSFREYHRQPINAVFKDLDEQPNDWREFNPDTLHVRLFGETVLPFDRVSSTNVNGRTTWIGRSDAGWIVAVSDAAGWVAEVNLSHSHGNSYRIYAGQLAVVTESTPVALPCLTITPTRKAASSQPSIQVPLPPVNLVAEELENMNISTVSVLYDGDVEADVQYIKDAANYTETVHELISLVVEASLELANIYLDWSEVTNFQWELGGIAKMQPYDFNGDYEMGRDLDMITIDNSIAGQAARTFFDQTHADQGVLMVGGERDIGGLAESPGNYSVVAWSVSDYLSYLLAHELAHNLGCDHDRITENAPDNNGLFNYGHTFTVGGYYIGTIMAYEGEYLLAQFSNPNLTYDGVPTGVPAGEPKAADNVRVIREAAAGKVSFRKHPDDPRITQQPQGGGYRTGQSLSVSVTATGPNLRYQWYKDDTKVEGATQAIYTLSSVTTTDSGRYFVTVTNQRGTVTSNNASITVTNAPAGGSGGVSSGGGGGGGGGGSPSLWFIVAMSLLAAYRLAFTRNKI